VYATAGTAKRADSEYIFNSEPPALLYAATQEVLLGGDFNCALQPSDTTGTYTTSRALTEVIRGLALSDAWSQDPQRPVYTYFSATGATRIGRFYITQDPLARKTGIEILPASFTDYNAVVLLLALPTFMTFGEGAAGKRTPFW
jgi:hypothetical protein